MFGGPIMRMDSIVTMHLDQGPNMVEIIKDGHTMEEYIKFTIEDTKRTKLLKHKGSNVDKSPSIHIMPTYSLPGKAIETYLKFGR